MSLPGPPVRGPRDRRAALWASPSPTGWKADTEALVAVQPCGQLSPSWRGEQTRVSACRSSGPGRRQGVPGSGEAAELVRRGARDRVGPSEWARPLCSEITRLLLFSR